MNKEILLSVLFIGFVALKCDMAAKAHANDIFSLFKEPVSKKEECVQFKQTYVNSDYLNVRASPNLNNEALFSLQKGMKINYLSESINAGYVWLKISVNDKYYRVAKSSLDGKKQYTNATNNMNSVESPDNAKILVDKSDRTMKVFEQGKIVKTFKIGLSGMSNRGNKMTDKNREGDGQTPEGEYYIAAKNSASWFGTNPKTGGKLGSLMISYPNAFDAWRGLNVGTIGIKEYRQICHSNKVKGIPPQNTGLGSYIMIHGGGSATDWTAGCISLNDQDMYWLYNNIKQGAKVYINL